MLIAPASLGRIAAVVSENVNEPSRFVIVVLLKTFSQVYEDAFVFSGNSSNSVIIFYSKSAVSARRHSTELLLFRVYGFPF